MQDAKTIEHIAGQRLMAGFIGTDLNPDLRFLIDTIGVGGIILFSRNITGRAQLTNLCKSAAAYAHSQNLPPLLIAVDQEGGAVARLKAPEFTEFEGAPAIRDEHDARRFARITATELQETGINMDMAPVLDVVPAGVDSIMSTRVFGTDPRWVAQMGGTVVEGLQESGIMSVAKHFPGIGRTTIDSHMHRPDLDTSMEHLSSFDLIPFYAAMEKGVSGIMLSHIRYTKIDPKWPASLSPEIAAKLLRGKMGYDGVVFTDDLEMGAIQKHYDMPVITRQLMAAEVDIALICKTRQRIEAAFESMCRQIKDGIIPKKSMERSIHRIAVMKSNMS